MLVCSHSLRHLLNDVILQRLNKQIFVQSKLFLNTMKRMNVCCEGNYLIRYQSQLNVKDFSNENDEKEMGTFERFNLDQQTQKRLKSLNIFSFNSFHNFIIDRGIEYLFPVQYRSFNEITAGKDCIVQARKNFIQKRKKNPI